MPWPTLVKIEAAEVEDGAEAGGEEALTTPCPVSAPLFTRNAKVSKA